MTARSHRLTTALARRLTEIRAQLSAAEKEYSAALEALPAGPRECGRNLVDYLALRRNDLRGVQRWLHYLGVSSLGHSESHVRDAVESVLANLRNLEHPALLPAPDLQQRAMRRSRSRLKRRTDALLGARRGAREVRIMVTMPTEAATQPNLVRNMLEAGMDCMRINCAHDGPNEWRAMIEHLREAREELKRPCSVLMDLAGPKLRTGMVAPGPAVRRLRPERDAFGRETAPARVTLVPADRAAPLAWSRELILPVDGRALGTLKVGDVLRFTDARGKPRQLNVVSTLGRQVICEGWQSAYITPGMLLERKGRHKTLTLTAFLGAPGEIPLQAGDVLVLDGRQDWPGTPAIRDSDGALVRGARISFTLPEILGQIKVGNAVHFDDGKIAAVVQDAGRDAITLRVTQTRPGGATLGGGKGVNLPESNFNLPALSEKDRADLAFAIKHADLVGLSFVRSPKDVEDLFEALHKGGGDRLGVVLKIETRQGVTRLPDLLLTVLRHDRVGVMIARGDLAIECDFRRMAELQEEILWFCEAAHVPVIWATEVLERLAKTGMPTRAEITDAAMAERAECVMLNKGPYIIEAIRVLDEILQRMSDHQHKKMARLRPLSLARLAKPSPPIVPSPAVSAPAIGAGNGEGGVAKGAVDAAKVAQVN